MKTIAILFMTCFAIAGTPVWGAAKNVISFIGDGAGVSSLNAASIY